MKVIKRAVLTLVVLALAGAAAVAGIGWHQGYRIYILHTGSMSPTLRPGDAVLDAPAPATVHGGEVITFRYSSGPDSVVTHRVVSYADGVVQTKGDANRSVDPWSLHLSQVVGTAAVPLPHVGYVLVYLKQPSGLASIATVTLGLVLLWQIFFPSEAVTTELGRAAAAEPRRERRGGRGARHRSSPSRRAQRLVT